MIFLSSKATQKESQNCVFQIPTTKTESKAASEGMSNPYILKIKFFFLLLAQFQKEKIK